MAANPGRELKGTIQRVQSGGNEGPVPGGRRRGKAGEVVGASPANPPPPWRSRARGMGGTSGNRTEPPCPKRNVRPRVGSGREISSWALGSDELEVEVDFRSGHWNPANPGKQASGFWRWTEKTSQRPSAGASDEWDQWNSVTPGERVPLHSLRRVWAAWEGTKTRRPHADHRNLYVWGAESSQTDNAPWPEQVPGPDLTSAIQNDSSREDEESSSSEVEEGKGAGGHIRLSRKPPITSKVAAVLQNARARETAMREIHQEGELANRKHYWQDTIKAALAVRAQRRKREMQQITELPDGGKEVWEEPWGWEAAEGTLEEQLRRLG